MHLRGVAHLGDEGAGKLHRKCLGFPLGEIDQDVGDVARLGREIEAGDDVGAVLSLGQARRGRRPRRAPRP